MDKKKSSKSMDVAIDFAAACRSLGMVPHFVLDAAKESGKFYEQFEITKKKGGVRKISASTGRLKHLQRQILRGLLSKKPLPGHVHGCVKGRSVLSNAVPHVNQEVVINFDLKNFFGTVTTAAVKSIFQKHFNFDEECAEIFANVCCYEGCLPQGAPTSPMLANYAALELDAAILNELKSETNYSRYVDDITISGTKEICSLLPRIYQIIEDCGFVSNLQKTRILRQAVRQSVTGIVVNKKVNASKRFIRKIRQNLHYCKKFGMPAHCEWNDISQDRFIREMNGSIGFIRMVQPELADSFSKQLKDVLPMSDIAEEETNILLLKGVIDNEGMVSFIYENVSRQMAPTEIYIDEDDDTICFKGFQFVPEPGWMEYRLALISDLIVQRNRLLNG